MRAFLYALFMLCVAGIAVSAEGAIPNRMGLVKPGEWLLMQEVAGPNAGDRVKFEAVEVRGSGADAVVVIRGQRFSGGEETESREIEIPVARYGQRLAELEDKAKQISRERLVVKDAEITVFAVSWDDEAEEPHEFKIWVSRDVPLGGIVKSWSSDPEFPAAEIIDYGF